MPPDPSAPPRSTHEGSPEIVSLPAVLPVEPSPARVDYEALFEELGERFERAAADLGIDVEV
jgi:hypothetical protein